MTLSRIHTAATPFKPVLSLAMLSLLGACAAPGLLEQAEGVNTGQNTYAAALHAGYLQQARLELDEADYSDSAHFSIKAIAAVDAGDVRPDLLIERRIGKCSKPALADARARLMQAKGASAIEIAPGALAGAQVAFDCWMQEAEENFQPKDIKACRRDFEISMAYVGAATAEYQARAAALDAIEPAAALVLAEPPVAMPGLYTVYFPFDSAVISELAAGILDQAVAGFDSGSVTRIRVAGHADRSGEVIYNEALSRRRAEAVVRYLTGQGVEDDLIQAQWYGEDRPAVPTADGVPDPDNRRVEVKAASQDRVAAK